MSSDSDDPTAAHAADDADVSKEMQDKLEQLEEHIDDAAKKAQEGRPQGDPASGDPVDDVAGGGTDNAEHVDDPEGPLVGPE